MVALESVKDFRLIGGSEEPIKALRYYIAQTGASHIKWSLADSQMQLNHLGILLTCRLISVDGAWDSALASRRPMLLGSKGIKYCIDVDFLATKVPCPFMMDDV